MLLSRVPATLIGRDGEKALVRELVGRTSSCGQALIIKGQAGVGKSALITDMSLVALQAGFSEFRCVGRRGRSGSPYAGLREMMQPLLPYADGLAPRQRLALLTSLGRAVGPSPDPLLIQIAALHILEEAAKVKPLLLMAEDIQWLDTSTVRFLEFVSHRLTQSPILVAGTCRLGQTLSPIPFQVPEITLVSLSRSQSARLLDGLPGSLSPAVRERVLDDARGNPLALVELVAALHARGLAFASTLPPWMTLTPRLAEALSARGGGQAPSRRRLLLMAAAGVGATIGELTAAGTRIGVVFDPFILQQQSLFTVTVGGLQFRDPIVRSVIYSDATVAERVSSHRALAAVIEDTGLAQWHLAAAAENGAARRGLAPAGPPQLRRGLAAVTESVQGVLRRRTGAGLVTPLEGTQTSLGVSAGGAGTATADRIPVAREVPASSAQSAAARTQALLHILFPTPTVSQTVSSSSCAKEEARRELAKFTTSRTDPLPLVLMGWIDEAPFPASLRVDLARLNSGGASPIAGLFGLGLAFESVQDLEMASQVWELAVERSTRFKEEADLSHAIMHRGRLHLLAGGLKDARIDLDHAERMALQRGFSRDGIAAAACVARLHSICGDAGASSAAVHRSRQAPDAEPQNAIAAHRHWAVGLGALCEGRFIDAWAALSDVSTHPVTALWAIGDLAEAAVGAGEASPVLEVVQDVEGVAVASGSPHLLSLAYRAKAVLSAGEGAGDHFERSLAVGAGRISSLEMARTQLRYGMWLRRRRQIVKAREHLRDAYACFDTVGARPWAIQAAAELRSAGVSARPLGVTRQPPASLLSEQELRIARLAATGLTNRQIADQVYLSHRTVGANLYRVFPKLGVTKRWQLGAALESDPMVLKAQGGAVLDEVTTS